MQNLLYISYFGRKNERDRYRGVAVIERWPTNRGFLSTILNDDAIGAEVSGRYSNGGR